jgi:hypothetical protein
LLLNQALFLEFVFGGPAYRYLETRQNGINIKQHNLLGLHRIDAPLQLERKTSTHSLHYFTTKFVPRERSTAALPLCCMHVEGAPPAKRAPRPPPAAPAPATTMTTSNSQRRRPTTRSPDPQNYLNFPNEPIHCDNKTLSTLICSRSPSSTSANTLALH